MSLVTQNINLENSEYMCICMYMYRKYGLVGLYKKCDIQFRIGL